MPGPPTLRTRETLSALGEGLRRLHRVLVEASRRDFERKRHAIMSAGELLQLLTSDVHFAWLRELSELIVDLEVLLEVDPAPGDDDCAAVRAEVERLLLPPAEAGSEGFGARYWPWVHDDPQVAIAHGEVKQALLALPDAHDVDAAAMLHARHLFREARGHRP